MHGVEWLKKCFEPATRDKANGEFRLLICDGHDSHISAEFIRHCIANDILLMLLPPHSSHLMQLLDVGVFFPLKQAMGGFLDRIYRTGISRIQKAEWFECLIKARAKAVNKKNIEGGWRGAGIYPMDPLKVIDKVPKSIIQQPNTPSSQSETATSFENVLLEGSSIDANALHSVNTILKEKLLTKEALQTPARKYIPRLASTAEWLLAENVILKFELANIKALISERKSREGGKRLILRGKIVISTAEVLKLIEEAEAATKNKKKGTGRPCGRPRKDASKEPIVVLEEAKSDGETSEDDGDDGDDGE